MDYLFCPSAVSWGNIADWVQAIGSIGAIASAIFLWNRQASLTRENHNQSLRPHLEIKHGATAIGSPNIFFSIINNGLGPAIIKKIMIYQDGKLIEGTHEDAIYAVTLSIRKLLKSGGVQEERHIPTRDEWIPPGKEICLLACSFASNESLVVTLGHENKRAQAEIDRVRIELVYESVFGEEFIYSGTS